MMRYKRKTFWFQNLKSYRQGWKRKAIKMVTIREQPLVDYGEGSAGSDTNKEQA